MCDEAKPSNLKGMLKRHTPVSIEEMNDAIRDQGTAAGQIGSEACDSALGDGKAGSKMLPSSADMLNDSEGCNIEFEPPKLELKLKPPKL
jgi:hypothetical protein